MPGKEGKKVKGNKEEGNSLENQSGVKP